MQCAVCPPFNSIFLSPYFPSLSLPLSLTLSLSLSLLLSLLSPHLLRPHLLSPSHPLLLTLHWPVQISPKISPNNGMYVHHMLLYQCLSLNEITDLGMGYDCNKATSTIRNCRLGRPIITAWAVGGNVRT